MTVLRIDLRDTGDQPRLCVTGELDVETAVDLTEAIDALPVDATAILDLHGLTFIDSSGLRALLHVHLSGREIVLANPRPAVLKVLDIAQVRDLFAILPAGV